jgi:hypothetical protein
MMEKFNREKPINLQHDSALPPRPFRIFEKIAPKKQNREIIF